MDRAFGANIATEKHGIAAEEDKATDRPDELIIRRRNERVVVLACAGGYGEKQAKRHEFHDCHGSFAVRSGPQGLGPAPAHGMGRWSITAQADKLSRRANRSDLITASFLVVP